MSLIDAGEKPTFAKSIWQSKVRSRLELACIVLVWVPLSITLLALAYRSTLRTQIMFNEGWNAYHSNAAAFGNQLYPPALSMVTNNYPPLSFYIVGWLGRILGDAIFSGRIVAWFSFLGIGVLVFAIVRNHAKDFIAASMATAVFIGYAVIYFPNYIGTNDPQWLAQAVILFGLYVYLHAPNAAYSSVAAGAIMALGLLIKHNVVALPLTLALWLFVYDWRSCLKFAAAGLMTGLSMLALFTAVFGTDFVSNLLAPRAYSIHRAYESSVNTLIPMQLLVVLIGFGAVKNHGDRLLGLFFLYFFVALVVGVIAFSGEGVAENAVFEVLIGASLTSGLLIGRWQGDAIRLWGVGVCALTLLIGTVQRGSQDIYFVRPWLDIERKYEENALQMIALIRSQDGPAACINLALCYWAGKQFELDSFNYTQAIRTGRRDESLLIERLVSGYYAAVEMTPAQGLPFPTPAVKEALTRHYEMKELPMGTLYLKRGGSVALTGRPNLSNALGLGGLKCSALRSWAEANSCSVP